VIDIHCHILPEVDDGPKSSEISEAMCRMAAEDGIEHIVATPHSNDHYFYDRDYLLTLLENLRQRIGPRPALSLGCDFHLSFDNMQMALRTGEILHRQKPLHAGGVQQFQHLSASGRLVHANARARHYSDHHAS